MRCGIIQYNKNGFLCQSSKVHIEHSTHNLSRDMLLPQMCKYSNCIITLFLLLRDHNQVLTTSLMIFSPFSVNVKIKNFTNFPEFIIWRNPGFFNFFHSLWKLVNIVLNSFLSCNSLSNALMIATNPYQKYSTS